MEEKTTKTAQEQWRDEYISTIARNVREYRDRLGISAQQLSDRTEKAGFKIPRSSIANIETGAKKSYPIHEMVTIARAFGLPIQGLLASPYHADELIRPYGDMEPIPAYNYRITPQEMELAQKSPLATVVTTAAESVGLLAESYSDYWLQQELIAFYNRMGHAVQDSESQQNIEHHHLIAEMELGTQRDLLKYFDSEGITVWSFENHVVADSKRKELEGWKKILLERAGG